MTDENAVTFGSLGDELPPEPKPEHRTLTGFLERISAPLAPGEVGGVPVPTDWECFRAVLGGVRRDDLERAHGEKTFGGKDDERLMAAERVERAKKEGTHLPAGLHIFTGQTGGGKSALVANLSRTAAKAGHPVLYVTLELDGEEIAARILSLESGVPWFKLALRKGLTGEERNARDMARGVFADPENNAAERIAVLAPLGPLNVDTLHREALALWRKHNNKVPLVVFDYLQLAAVRTGDNYRAPLREAIAAVVLELRTLSRRRDDEPEWPGCPVVVLSTTARANVKGESAVRGLDGKDPDALRFEDLETLKALPKEAGEVEATAVTAWVLALGETDTNGTRPLTMRLVKNRLGLPSQWVPFRFHGPTGRLEEEPARYAVTNGGGGTTPVEVALKGKKSK